MQNTCASLAFSSLEELQLSWAIALLANIFNASCNRHIILRWVFTMFKMVPVKASKPHDWYREPLQRLHLPWRSFSDAQANRACQKSCHQIRSRGSVSATSKQPSASRRTSISSLSSSTLRRHAYLSGATLSASPKPMIRNERQIFEILPRRKWSRKASSLSNCWF